MPIGMFTVSNTMSEIPPEIPPALTTTQIPQQIPQNSTGLKAVERREEERRAEWVQEQYWQRCRMPV